MAFDIYFQRFADGDATTADELVAADVLGPLLTDRDGAFARIITSDGGADAFGVDQLADGLMINHAEGRVVWDVMFKLAHAAGYAVMPVGCPTCVTSSEALTGLPDGIRDDAVVITSGADLLRPVESS